MYVIVNWVENLEHTTIGVREGGSILFNTKNDAIRFGKEKYRNFNVVELKRLEV